MEIKKILLKIIKKYVRDNTLWKWFHLNNKKKQIPKYFILKYRFRCLAFLLFVIFYGVNVYSRIPYKRSYILQTKLTSIKETLDQAELQALTQLKIEVNNAPTKVQELLPGGNSSQYLTQIYNRLLPLNDALALQAKLASIKATHDQAELQTLTQLKTEVNNASTKVQELLPGGNSSKYLTQIYNRLLSLNNILTLQANLSSIVISPRANAEHLLEAIIAASPGERTATIENMVSTTSGWFDLNVVDQHSHNVLFYARNYSCNSSIIRTLEISPIMSMSQ